MGTAKIVVVGNEKGGSGKSTVAMHLIVALLAQGSRVASIDLDARQATLTRYIEHRQKRSTSAAGLPLPEHVPLMASDDSDSDSRNLTGMIENLAERADALVIDTPGSDQPLSRLAHARADVLVTPLNDSLLDLDSLARVDPESRRVSRPGPYSAMVWEARKHRALARLRPTDWFVLRNRLSALDTRNKRVVGGLLADLATRIGFTLLDGLTERVIYRELFLDGLTLADLGGARSKLTMSQVAARHELRRLMEALGLDSAEALPTTAMTR